ncbi:cytochrome P450 [Lichtheimia hyalospora FSU 10163]|nr:cytochrome P450 [Lichtheimia hyalospora FSU 10163]
MGSILSVFCTLAASYLVSQLVQAYMWKDRYDDGQSKAQWPSCPPRQPMFWNSYKRFKGESYRLLTTIGQEMGDVFSMKLIQRRIIVLNHADVVRKALVEHQHENSSKPQHSHMGSFEYIMTEQGKTVFTAQFSSYWSRLRKAIHQVLGSKTSVDAFDQEFSNRAERFASLNGVIDTDELRELVNLLAMEFAVTLVIGEQAQQNELEMIETLKGLIATCEEGQLLQSRKWYYQYGAFLSIARIMGITFKQHEAIRVRNKAIDILLSLSSDDDKSITSRLRHVEPSKQDPEPQQFTPEEIAINQLHLVMHGYQHLSSALFTAIQRIASLGLSFQDELRGGGVPLMNAFIAESLRYNPPMRLYSHAPRMDHEIDFDEGRIYRMDENTDILVNLDAIHFDPQAYPDPSNFNPKRFISPPGSQNPSILDKGKLTTPVRDHLAFGVGRRACQGSRASQRIMLLVLLSLIRRYNLEGGNVNETIDYPSAVWSWSGRSETKGAPIKFIPRQ